MLNWAKNNNGPVINSFAPASGPVGTPVVIAGANFTGASAVQFGGVAATYTVDADSRISATVPAGAATGPIAVTTPVGTGTSAGQFKVTAGPANDAFADRTVLSGSSVNVAGSNIGATKESGEPAHAGNAGGRSVWWSWTAPADGSFAISTQGSGFDTLLGVYLGQAVDSLTTVASNDDDPAGGNTSVVSINAIAGTTYQIAVDGLNGASGSIALSIYPQGFSSLLYATGFEAAEGFASGTLAHRPGRLEVERQRGQCGLQRRAGPDRAAGVRRREGAQRRRRVAVCLAPGQLRADEHAADRQVRRLDGHRRLAQRQLRRLPVAALQPRRRRAVHDRFQQLRPLDLLSVGRADDLHAHGPQVFQRHGLPARGDDGLQPQSLERDAERQRARHLESDPEQHEAARFRRHGCRLAGLRPEQSGEQLHGLRRPLDSGAAGSQSAHHVPAAGQIGHRRRPRFLQRRRDRPRAAELPVAEKRRADRRRHGLELQHPGHRLGGRRDVHGGDHESARPHRQPGGGARGEDAAGHRRAAGRSRERRGPRACFQGDRDRNRAAALSVVARRASRARRDEVDADAAERPAGAERKLHGHDHQQRRLGHQPEREPDRRRVVRVGARRRTMASFPTEPPARMAAA